MDNGTVQINFDIITANAMKKLDEVQKKMKDIAKDAEKGVEMAGNGATTPIKSEADNASMRTAFDTIKAYFSLNTIKAVVGVAVDAAEVNYNALDAKILGGMNDREFKDYKVNLRNLSVATGIDRKDIVSASNDLLSNDISKEDIGWMNKLAAKLARVNGSTAQESSGVLASIKNALKIQSEEQMSQVLDYITKSNIDLGRVDIGALQQGLKRNASFLTSGKIKLSDYLAMGEVFTAQGIGQEESQTYITNYLASIDSASASTKKWAKEVLNLDFSMKHLKNVGVEKFTKEIMDKTGGNTDYIAKLFGNIRGRNAFDALSSSLDKYKQALNGLKNSRGVTDEIFGEKMSDPYMQWTISVNKFKESIASLGEKILPVLTLLVNGITFVADAINAIPAPVAQAGAALIIFGSTAMFVSSAVGIFKNIVGGIPSVLSILPAPLQGGIQWLMKFGKAALSVVGKLMILVYAIWFMAENFDVAANAVGSVLSSLAAIVSFSLGSILKAVDIAATGILNAFIGMANGIGSVINGIGNALGQEGWGFSFDGVKQTFIGDAGDALWNFSNTAASVGKNMGDLSVKNYKEKGLNFNPFSSKDKADSWESMLSNYDDIGEYEDIIKDVGDAGNAAGTGWDNAGGKANSAKNNIDSLSNSLDNNKKSWEDLKNELEQIADNFNNVSAKFEQMSYKVVNSADLLKKAQYNLAITQQWSSVRDSLLGNSNLSGYALNYIAGLDATNLGELKALAGMSSKDLSAWNSMMNSMDRINTQNAGQTQIVNNNYTINRVSNEKEIVNYIYKIMKKQGLAK